MFNNKRTALMLGVILMGVAASFTLVTAFAFAKPVHLISQNDLKEDYLAQQHPIVFPLGAAPWYAQDEIFVKPELPVPGSPLEICAEVVNIDPAEPHAAALHFGIAPLGIGVPYEPVGIAEVVVPPDANTFGCVSWIPPAEGSWGFEVLLWQEGADEPFRSLKNIDIWEPLLPGVPHD